MSAVPVPGPGRRQGASGERILLTGDVPQPAQPAVRLPVPHPLPEGAGVRCADEVPPLREVRPGHVVACHWAEQIDAGELRPRAEAVVRRRSGRLPVGRGSGRQTTAASVRAGSGPSPATAVAAPVNRVGAGEAAAVHSPACPKSGAAISRDEVAHLARLSRLAVTDEELDRSPASST